MSTTIPLDLPLGISWDKGFEVVISRDGNVVSRTIHTDITKAKIKKEAVRQVKEYLDINYGRGNWVATVYEAHVNSYTDVNTFVTSNEWVRSNNTPFFTF